MEGIDFRRKTHESRIKLSLSVQFQVFSHLFNMFVYIQSLKREMSPSKTFSHVNARQKTRHTKSIDQGDLGARANCSDSIIIESARNALMTRIFNFISNAVRLVRFRSEKLHKVNFEVS